MCKHTNSEPMMLKTGLCFLMQLFPAGESMTQTKSILKMTATVAILDAMI